MYKLLNATGAALGFLGGEIVNGIVSPMVASKLPVPYAPQILQWTMRIGGAAVGLTAARMARSALSPKK